MPALPNSTARAGEDDDVPRDTTSAVAMAQDRGSSNMIQA